MMYDADDRLELLEILDNQYKDARELIESEARGVLPQSMTQNGETTGITFTFRKLRLPKENK